MNIPVSTPYAFNSGNLSSPTKKGEASSVGSCAEPKFGAYFSVEPGTTVQAVENVMRTLPTDNNKDDFVIRFHSLTTGQGNIADGRCLIMPRDTLEKLRGGHKWIQEVLVEPQFAEERVVITDAFQIIKSDAAAYLHRPRLREVSPDAIRSSRKIKRQVSDCYVRGILSKASKDNNYELLLADEGHLLGIATDAEKSILRKYYDAGLGHRMDYDDQLRLHQAFTHIA